MRAVAPSDSLPPYCSRSVFNGSRRAARYAGNPVAARLTSSRIVVAAAKVIGSLALLIVVFKVSLVVPFLGGSKNAIGLLIIGFALWEAWKFNARRPLPITGPYYVGPPGRAPGISTGGAFSDPEVIL